jgi:hypothetical protein
MSPSAPPCVISGIVIRHAIDHGHQQFNVMVEIAYISLSIYRLSNVPPEQLRISVFMFLRPALSPRTSLTVRRGFGQAHATSGDAVLLSVASVVTYERYRRAIGLSVPFQMGRSVGPWPRTWRGMCTSAYARNASR